MSAADASTLRLALVGNPNCGKTALFNQLTGSRQKVANYAGVTVERKEGRLHSAASGRHYAVLDLPGAYSLHAASLDEAVTRDLIRGFYPGEPVPDLLVCVVDATNLRLHLRFALEVRELGQPMIVAVNMMDAARHRILIGKLTVRTTFHNLEPAPLLTVVKCRLQGIGTDFICPLGDIRQHRKNGFNLFISK